MLALAAESIARTEPLDHGQRDAIINTASIAAFEGQIGQAAYASSKGGILGLNLPAARDLAQYGNRVNTIAPGIVETPMLATVSEELRAALASGIPFARRLGRPEEYAELALFLISMTTSTEKSSAWTLHYGWRPGNTASAVGGARNQSVCYLGAADASAC